MADETIDIEVTILRITEKAYLVEMEDLDNKTIEEWIPKSQVKSTDCLAEGDQGSMESTEWNAKLQELIEEED